jgi:oligosaccharide repeat unit polymerase
MTSLYNHSASPPAPVISAPWLALIIAIVVTGLCFAVSDDLLLLTIAFVALTLVAALLGRLNILHPFTWYVPIYCLYSISMALLVLNGLLPDRGSLPRTLLVEWVALVAFLVGVGPGTYKPAYNDVTILRLEYSSWLVYGISFVMTAMFLYGIVHGGLTDKFQVIHSFWGRFDPAFSILAAAYAVLLAVSFSAGKLPLQLIGWTMLWNILAFMIGGQRAFIFRIVLITLVMFHALYRRLNSRFLFLIAITGLVMSPILQDLKNVLIRQDTIQVDLQNPVLRVLGDELLSASDNLRFLIQEGVPQYFYGETLLWDLRQVVTLSAFANDKSVAPAPTIYFNNTFYPEVVARGGGRGFTLVGEGYMNFGVAGAAIWYLGLGMFIRFLYRRACRNVLWLVTYSLAMPLTIYVTRADLSNLISPFLKHIALPLLVICSLQRAPLGAAGKALKLRLRVQPVFPA